MTPEVVLTPQSAFAEDVRETAAMLRVVDDPSDAMNMLDSLMNRAETESASEQQRRENVEMVDSLLRVFLRSNAERAKDMQKARKQTNANKPNPVQEIRKEILAVEEDETLLMNKLRGDGRKDEDVKATFGPALPPAKTTTSTTTMATSTERFKEILHETGDDKDAMEDEIMGMILEDPDTVVETISGMFEHSDATRQELAEMIEKDPVGVTVAFSDLMMKHNEIMKLQPEVVEATQRPREEHIRVPIEEPPPEMRGQMQRLRQRPTTNAPKTPEEDKMPAVVLDTMLALIDQGELSHEQIIEEMINGGLLPVEVTEFGRIPITVGNTNKERVSRPRPRRPRPRGRERKKPQAISFEDIEPLPEREEKSEEDKDIDVKDSMRELFHRGLISRGELLEMMAIIDGKPIVKTTTPKPFSSYASGFAYDDPQSYFSMTFGDESGEVKAAY